MNAIRRLRSTDIVSDTGFDQAIEFRIEQLTPRSGNLALLSICDRWLSCAGAYGG